MRESNDISRAIELLKQTLPEMSKRNIATTPENYAVWYEYISGENQELVQEINLLDLNKTVFTTEVHRDLYNRFIAGAKESAVNKLSASVKDIISEILSKLSNEGKDLSAYASILYQINNDVQETKEILDIKEMISTLVTETSKREASTRDMQNTLENMSSELKQLRAEVARLNSETTVDPVTKVSNKRAFDIDLEQVISSAEVDEKPLSIMVLDIDDFGNFNSQFGRDIADKVLRFVATLFKRNVKGSDVVARLCDDEFAILLPETDYTGAVAVAENIKERLSKQTLSDSAAKVQLGRITVSVGVTNYKAQEYSEDFLKRAQRCLKEAKTKQNCVIGEPAT